jgi:hypothetical protein
MSRFPDTYPVVGVLRIVTNNQRYFKTLYFLPVKSQKDTFPEKIAITAFSLHDAVYIIENEGDYETPAM